MRHQAKVQACLLAVLVLVTACGQAVGSSARRGSQAVDPGFFFAGPVVAFGRTLSPADTATLSYLRALRAGSTSAAWSTATPSARSAK